MRIICAILFCCVAFVGCQSASQENSADLQNKVYRQAMDVGDLNTAIVATQALIALDSSRQDLHDSLVMLYFQSGKYVQSAKLAANVLKKDPTDRKYLEIIARSLQGGGQLPEAAGYYQKLSELTGDPVYDYQLAALNFNAERFEQSIEYVQKLLNDPKIDTATVKLFSEDGTPQLIPLKAAAYNLLGSIQARQKKTKEALENFHKALLLDSSFQIAKQNIQHIGG